MASPEEQATWSRQLLDAFIGAGLGHVIISPGSRSTPLVLAISEREDELSVHTAIDERSAGFMALGQARVCGRPTLLVCTSGSAGAHYFPAVVEASAADVPMLIVTADRPSELQQSRAPQTLDQVRLYGPHVRGFFELGAPDAKEGALRGLARAVHQSVALSQGPHAGPVHLNFKAKKPLEFALVSDPGQPGKRAAIKVVRGVSHLTEEQLEPIARLARHAQRPVLAVGPHCPYAAPNREAVLRFVQATGWPLIAEPTSNLRHLESSWDGFDLAYRAIGAALQPDLVVQIGDPPVSGAWATATARSPKVIVSKNAWPDPSNGDAYIVQADADPFLNALAGVAGKANAEWRALVGQAERLATEAIDAHVSAEDAAHFDELVALRTVCDALKAEDLVTIGNSLSVRVLDTVLTRHHAVVPIVSQRGLNGIDGLVAGAAGGATVHPGRNWLVLGDVAFRHDVGSLQLLTELQVPLTIIVLDNGGGQIFTHLPLFDNRRDSAAPPPVERWTTPSPLGAAQLAAAFGLESAQVASRTELATHLKTARLSAKPSVIAVKLPGSGSRAAYAKLTATLQAWFA